MQPTGFRKTLLGACIALALSATASTSAAPPAHAKVFGAGAAVQIDDLPPGILRNQLKALPDQARQNALSWLSSFQFHEHDVPFLRADKDGGIYFTDTFLPTLIENTETTEPSTSSAGSISATNVFNLHSKPGSSKVIYLDFDGHVISGTAWNSSSSTLTAVPYDLDGAPDSFSATEMNNIAEIWRRISEDYSPFDVDVTTELPASFGPTTGRVLITKDTDANGQAMPSQGAGGVAYVGVWGNSSYATRYSPALVYYNRLGNGRPDYVTEAASHEMGHNMGLSHDGTSTSAYYGGHGTGFISWGPIMGTGYNRNVSQWSQGEYTDANQFQDDVAIIASKVNLRTDDHANQMSQATPLVVDAAGNILSSTPANDPNNLNSTNKGIINSRTDVDVFSFNTSGGLITLQATPARETSNTRGGNLDILLSLYDQFGNLITSSNPEDDTDAGISMSVGAGKYYLTVQGTGSTNYSDYGSLGQYHIEGVLPQNSDETAPTPNPMGWAEQPAAIDHDSIHMTAVTAVDDTSSVEYYFACAAGGNGCADSGWVTSPDYTANGLDAETSYTYKVKARDAFGNETVSSAEASATTDAAPAVNQPPVANTDSAQVAVKSTVVIPVLDNDSDPEGDALSIISVGRASKGTVTHDGQQLTYTAGKKTGSDSFTYTISDGHGNTATTSVSVTISSSTSGGDTGGGGNGGGGKGRNTLGKISSELVP